MLLFCPSCSNVLTVSTTTHKVPSSAHSSTMIDDTINRLECQTCPYQYLLEKRYFERKAFTRVEKEDVIGGPAQWANADKMQVQCPKDGCDGREAAFFQVQIRSADEPMTVFLKCMACDNRWREH